MNKFNGGGAETRAIGGYAGQPESTRGCRLTPVWQQSASTYSEAYAREQVPGSDYAVELREGFALKYGVERDAD